MTCVHAFRISSTLLIQTTKLIQYIVTFSADVVYFTDRFGL